MLGLIVRVIQLRLYYLRIFINVVGVFVFVMPLRGFHCLKFSSCILLAATYRCLKIKENNLGIFIYEFLFRFWISPNTLIFFKTFVILNKLSISYPQYEISTKAIETNTKVSLLINIYYISKVILSKMQTKETKTLKK